MFWPFLSFVCLLLITAPAMAQRATEAVAVSSAVTVEPEFVYDDHAQRDPFLPLVTAGGAVVTYDTSFAVAEMTLEGIVSDGQGGVAIINGTVIEQGKPFGLYMVQKIERDRVILVKDGQISELRLKKEE
ncbi:MAG: hypothetical protein WCO69_05140 [Candidatus Omnitrophota bacterium]